MSELCAVFLYVLYKEQVLKPAFITDNDSFLFYLFHSNNEFLEHDTFLMFNKFMSKGFMNCFKYSDEIYTNSFLSHLDSEQKKALTRNDIVNSNDCEIKKRIFLLYYDIFPQIDKTLYKFMVDKIDPEIFIFRWYLCAFTREFPINKVVHLWDLILLVEFIEEKKKEENKNKITKIKKYKKKDNKKDKKIKNLKDSKIHYSNDINENKNEIKNLKDSKIKIYDNYYSHDNKSEIKINDNINDIYDSKDNKNEIKNLKDSKIYDNYYSNDNKNEIKNLKDSNIFDNYYSNDNKNEIKINDNDNINDNININLNINENINNEINNEITTENNNIINNYNSINIINENNII
jgi:hypothetical protein